MNNLTVIGIGKLGLGFALLLEKNGYNICGVDINQTYVDMLNEKKFTSNEPEYNNLLQNSTKFKATTSLQEGLNHSSYIFIIVQTPNYGGQRFYDHSILSNLLENINKYKVNNKHIIIGCTIMPRYIDEVGLELLKDCHDISLSYNPEFIAQGEIVDGFINADNILIGTNSKIVIKKLTEIYNKICHNQPIFSIVTPFEAEIVKLSINGYITTKLSFCNMISDYCDTVDVNKFNVLKAIGSDYRIGTEYFKPGFSFGGPCFPRDTCALSKAILNSGINTDLLLATTKYNEFHVYFQSYQLYKKYCNNNDITLEDVCYKPNSNIDIIEESAQLKIASLLKSWGKNVIIKDKKLVIDNVKKEFGNIFKYEIK